ncbi:hypothetical protein ACFV2X_38360 [Streptomyces sp. NPDC059679]|uniref:hypothetical protein n=1 Tax=Streptomyces sp. NPDC059679 TaxID=3346903 RepID=UPI0036B2BCCA
MTGPDDPNWRWEFRCEDFVYARLAEAQVAAEALPPGPARDAELNRVDSLYLIASQHNIWVDSRGRSAGRCITCKPSDGGVPCLTMTGLARLWRTHPDYQPGWNQAVDQPESCGGHTYREYKKRSTIYTRREAELNAFYDRFDLVQENGAEFWRCRSCGTEGDRWTDRISIETAAAIGTAAHRHPTCPERTSP